MVSIVRQGKVSGSCMFSAVKGPRFGSLVLQHTDVCQNRENSKADRKRKNFKSVKPAECVGLEVRRKYMEKTYLHQNLFMGRIMWESKKCPLT